MPATYMPRILSIGWWSTRYNLLCCRSGRSPSLYTTQNRLIYQRTLNHWLSSLPRCRNSLPWMAVLVQSVSRGFDVISGQQRGARSNSSFCSQAELSVRQIRQKGNMYTPTAAVQAASSPDPLGSIRAVAIMPTSEFAHRAILCPDDRGATAKIQEQGVGVKTTRGELKSPF